MDVGFKLFRHRCDLHDKTALFVRLNQPLDDAQRAPVRPRRIAAPIAADLRRHTRFLETRQARGEQRARRLDLGERLVERRDLPVPARQRQFELRIAQLAGLRARVVARRRHIGDDGAQIDAEPLIETLFSGATVNGGKHKPGDKQDRHTPQRRRGEQPCGERTGRGGARLHRVSASPAAGSSR